MKIMFAVASYWPSQDGVAQITRYLAEGLAAKGHQVLAFTSAGNGGLQILPETETYAGVQIERMRVFVQWPMELRGRDERSTKAYYINRIKSFEPEVLIVVCAQTWTLDWLVPVLDEIKCPKVFYSHGYSKWKENYHVLKTLSHLHWYGALSDFKCKQYYDSLYKAISKFDLAIYLSDQNNSYHYAQKHKLTNGTVLENAIDDYFFTTQMQHDMRDHEQGIQFLFVANYGENKNHDMLLAAYSKANIGKSRLVFVGFEENDYYNMLVEHYKEWFSEQPQKEVVFGVRKEREEVYQLYQKSDVFVCPSKSETWSIVAHEAAACGLPIISTDVGIYSTIQGATIVQNEQQMIAAIEQLYYNDILRYENGQKEVQWIAGRNCRISDKIQWLEQQLQSLIAERSTAKALESKRKQVV